MNFSPRRRLLHNFKRKKKQIKSFHPGSVTRQSEDNRRYFILFFYQIKSLKILFTLGIYLSLLLLFKLSAAAAAHRPLYWPS